MRWRVPSLRHLRAVHRTGVEAHLKDARTTQTRVGSFQFCSAVSLLSSFHPRLSGWRKNISAPLPATTSPALV